MNFPYKLNIPLEYCVIEVIFGELLNLPAPRYIEVFYASLLLELCRLKSDIVPQVCFLSVNGMSYEMYTLIIIPCRFRF